MSVESDDPNMNRAFNRLGEAFRNAGRAMSDSLPAFVTRNPTAHFRLTFRGTGIAREWFNMQRGDRRVLSQEIVVSSSGEDEYRLTVIGADYVRELLRYIEEHNGRVVDLAINRNPMTRNNPSTLLSTGRLRADLGAMDLSALEQRVSADMARQSDRAVRTVLEGGSLNRVSDGNANDMVDAMRMAFQRTNPRDLPRGEIAFVMPELNNRPFLIELQARNLETDRDQMRRQDVLSMTITATSRVDMDMIRGMVGGAEVLLQQEFMSAVQDLLDNRLSRDVEPERHRDERVQTEEQEVLEPVKGKRHIDLD